MAVHADSDMPNARPRVQPGAERVQRPVVREHRAPGEPERGTEEAGRVGRARATESPGPPVAAATEGLSAGGSLNRRTFSMAMTAWSAKVCRRATSSSLKAPGDRRVTVMEPITCSWWTIGTTSMLRKLRNDAVYRSRAVARGSVSMSATMFRVFGCPPNATLNINGTGPSQQGDCSPCTPATWSRLSPSKRWS